MLYQSPTFSSKPRNGEPWLSAFEDHPQFQFPPVIVRCPITIWIQTSGQITIPPFFFSSREGGPHASRQQRSGPNLAPHHCGKGLACKHTSAPASVRRLLAQPGASGPRANGAEAHMHHPHEPLGLQRAGYFKNAPALSCTICVHAPLSSLSSAVSGQHRPAVTLTT